MADLATFTEAMKEQLDLKDNKWIAVGGSYPGSLAAWYRLKYPHLVDVAVAVSAPTLAQLDFKGKCAEEKVLRKTTKVFQNILEASVVILL